MPLRVYMAYMVYAIWYVTTRDNVKSFRACFTGNMTFQSERAYMFKSPFRNDRLYLLPVPASKRCNALAPPLRPATLNSNSAPNSRQIPDAGRECDYHRSKHFCSSSATQQVQRSKVQGFPTVQNGNSCGSGQ